MLQYIYIYIYYIDNNNCTVMNKLEVFVFNELGLISV